MTDNRKRRGEYKKWLVDPSCSIPRSTKRSREKRAKLKNEFSATQIVQNIHDSSDDSDTETFIKRRYLFNDNEGENETDSETDDNKNEPEKEMDYTEIRNNIDNIEDNIEENDIVSENDIEIEDERVQEILNVDTEDTGDDDIENLNYVREYDSYDDVDNDLIYNRLHAESENDNYEERAPIYEGCNITMKESELLILNFCNRHHITDVGLDDLLQLINCHLPQPVFRSKYHLLKNYKTPDDYKTHYYCPTCFCTLDNDTEKSKFICKSCHNKYDKHLLRENKNYFLQIPLKPQIEEFVNSQNYNLIKRPNNENSSVSNITSGQYYKSLQTNIISRNDLTLQFNTDGVKIFKSSTLSLWPVQVGINELEYLERRKRLFLTLLWFGNDKPKMNTFLKILVDELVDLHNVGVTRVTEEGSINIKIHTMACSVDSVARPAVQNVTQYNGGNGCSFCKHKGEIVSIGRGFTNVYPGDIGELRTMEEHERFAHEAEKTNTPVMGVKGLSQLMRIPYFSIIDSFIPDYMHSLLLGVVKTFTEAWFNSVNHDRPWYIAAHLQNIENKLKSIKPPCEITRTPRKLKDRNLWKASEWKNFLCYYSLVCLEGYLPKKYLDHWFLLIYSIRIFLQQNISPDQFLKASNILKHFVLAIEPLYGKQFCKFNTHLLLHYSRAVQLFGALWDTSTFPYEHYNGVLAKMFRNSQSVPEQICKSYNRFKATEYSSIITFSHPECPENVKKLYINLLSNVTLSNLCIEEGAFLRILGAYEEQNLSIIEQTCIEELLQEKIEQKVKIYHRFIFKNVMWHGFDKNSLEKRDNSSATLKDGNAILMKCIVRVTTNHGDDFIILARLYENEKKRGIVTHNSLRISSKENFDIYSLTERIIAIHPQEIHEKLVCIPYSNNLYCLTTLVNHIEKD